MFELHSLYGAKLKLYFPSAYLSLKSWSGLAFPSPEDLPDPGTEARSPASQADSLPSLSYRGVLKSYYKIHILKIQCMNLSFSLHCFSSTSPDPFVGLPPCVPGRALLVGEEAETQEAMDFLREGVGRDPPPHSQEKDLS